MHQHQHLRIVDAAQRNAEKIADAEVDRHPHALQGAAQHDAFAMKFDVPHAAVGADVVRIEADGQERGSSRNARLDPAGLIPLVDV